MMPIFITPLALILLQLFTSPTQQQPRTTIEGIVVRLGTGEAIPKALVTLINTTQSGTPVAPVFTDSLGRFVFQNIEPGSYRISAARNGYVRQEYGQRVPLGRPGSVLNVAVGQVLKDVAIRLTPTGTISGRITDNTGEPLPG